MVSFDASESLLLPDFECHSFLGTDFHVASPEKWRDLILADRVVSFDYLVTPNVDHVVQLSRREDIRAAYSHAQWRLCDSQILNRLAALRGLDLISYAGADLVRDLLEDPRSRERRISVIGPSRADFDQLVRRYPQHNFIFIDAPMMQPGTPPWESALARLEASKADIHLLCLSFPKQEFFAHDLKLRARARGLALCVGASVDFLTNRQKRAPVLFRKTGTEWAYRLMSNPKRMWRRYLVDGPRIFVLFLKERP